MSIDFDSARWERVRENSRAWWAGELKRPLIQITMGGSDPGRPAPNIPIQHFTAFYDSSVSAEAIVDRWDYDLSCTRFLGDAYPQIWNNFGAGVAAALMGAELDASGRGGTVWFHPAERKEITDISFEYDPDNIWLKRISDVYRAAIDRWQGTVQVGMTDLGGNLDILSSFRPGEQLLYDLYDHPEDVKRLNWQAHDLWWRYFDEFNSILRPANPGYTSWASFFSEEPHYILQCDFLYMLGPDMFEEFVKPELEASCKKLTNAFYHLDGVGQLPSLDSLLAIPELKGIQWVPGTGNPDTRYWPEVYRKIRDAGKLIYLYGEFDALDVVAEQLGSAEGIVFITGCGDEQQAIDLLKRFNVE